MENNMNVITEINIDGLMFQVTANPFEKASCILWHTDGKTAAPFKAIGKFSGFDKRKILNFIARYVTDRKLRDEIENRKFEVKLNSMSLYYFRRIESAVSYDRESAYRELFDLGPEIERGELSRRMRMMTRRFHPDIGGDTRAMALINEAYSYLIQRSQTKW